MNKSIRTLAASALLVAIAVAPALAQNSKPAAPAAAPARTEAKAKSTTAHHATMTKEQYKAAQEGLAKGGYFKGTPNGVWNKASMSALKAWQKANKMPVNGKLTAEELTKLSA